MYCYCGGCSACQSDQGEDDNECHCGDLPEGMEHDPSCAAYNVVNEWFNTE